MLTKLLLTLAAIAVSGGVALANDDSTTVDPLDVETGSPSPTVEPTDEPSDEPTIEPSDEPSDEPTVEPQNVPNGNAYGWWRNRGVIKEKPGNGPKPNAHAEANAGGDTAGDDVE